MAYIFKTNPYQYNKYSTGGVSEQLKEDFATIEGQQSYLSKVGQTFRSEWDSISEDLNRTAMDTEADPLEGLFTPVKGANTQFYGKTLPTAIGVGTRAVLSPLSGLFGGFSSQTSETESEGVGSRILGAVGETFEGVQNMGTAIGKAGGLEDRYSSLLSEGVTNIITGELGEAGLSSLFRAGKVGKLKNLDETRKLVEVEKLEDVAASEFTNLWNKNAKIDEAKRIMDTFHNKINSGDLTRTDLIQTKRELTGLGVKDTSYFTERFNDTHSSSTIKDIATEETLKKVDGIINKEKLLSWYNKPETAPVGISQLIFNIKKIEELGGYKSSGIIISPTADPKINPAIRRAFKGDLKAIDDAIAYKKEIFKGSDDETLAQLYADNQAKKALGEDGMDSEENPFKREALVNLVDNGVLREDVKSSTLYSYKLTEKGAKISKRLGFSDEQIANAKTEGFVKHKIEEIDKFREDRFTFPEVIDNKDLTLANTLKETEGVEFNLFKKIVNRLNKSNSLGFDTAIAEATTVKDLIKIVDKINAKASDLLINSESFKPFKLKGISDTSFIFKNIPKDIADRVVNKTNFSLEKNRIINSFEKQIGALKNKYKNNLEKLSLATKNALDKKNSLLLEVRLKYKQFGEIKSERIKEFRNLATNKLILGNVDRAISKVVKNKSWNVVNTVEELKTQFEKLDKEIAIAHTRGLQSKITKELNNTIRAKKSTSKSVRTNLTPEIEQMLLEIKNVWKANKNGYVNIDELNQLLYNVRDLKSKSREIAKDAQIEMAKIISDNISTIKKEGIRNLFGTDDIETKGTTLEKLKGYIGNWENVSTFMYNTLGKIFGHTSEGKMSKGMEIYNANPVRASNIMNNWIEKFQKPLAQLLVDELGPDLNEWGLAMLARQIDNSKKNIYVGLDRIENSPKLKKEYLIKRDSNIGKQPEWLNDENRNKFKNTKLGEALEKMESETAWSFSKAKWNEFHDNLFNMHQSVTNRHDGILMIKRQDYFKAMAEKTVNEMEFDEPSYLARASLDNSSANELVSTTKGLGIDYNIDPIKTLLWGDRSSIIQSFLRDSFEEMVQTHIGKQYKFKNLDEATISSLLETGEWKLTDKMGMEVDQNSVSLDTLYLSNTKGGIRSVISKSTDKIITEYMKKISKGGSIKMNGIERVVSGVLNQYTANTLGFSLSAILQQPLSLMHGMAVMGARRTLKCLSDIINEPELIKRAEEASSAIRSRKGDNFMFNDILEKTYDTNFIGKIKELLRKYNEFALYLMRAVDEKTYASIWITAYKEWMEKNGFKFDGDFYKEQAIKYADVMADKIAGTTNKINVPPMFNSLVGQMFFKLASTKINEWQTIKSTTLDAFKRVDTTRGLKTMGIYTASNLVQAGIVYTVAKALYGIGFTNYNPDKEGDLIQQIFSIEGAYNFTVGNSPMGMKASGLVNFGTLTMADSLVDSVAKSLKGMSEGEIQGIIDFISTFIGERPIQYIQNSLD